MIIEIIVVAGTSWLSFLIGQYLVYHKVRRFIIETKLDNDKEAELAKLNMQCAQMMSEENRIILLTKVGQVNGQFICLERLISRVMK